MRNRPLSMLVLALVSVSVAAGALARSNDKPKPVRAALTARYDTIAAAWRRRDLAAVLASRTGDFRVAMPSGQVWDSLASAQYTAAALAQVETTLTLSFGLGTIDVHGDTAAAEIAQHWVRRQQKGGRLRTVDTRADQRETWIRRGDAWWLWRVDHVRPGAWVVDGKRIDPSKPYDPDAPPFTGRPSP